MFDIIDIIMIIIFITIFYLLRQKILNKSNNIKKNITKNKIIKNKKDIIKIKKDNKKVNKKDNKKNNKKDNKDIKKDIKLKKNNKDIKKEENTDSDLCYLDISIDNKFIGKILIKLYDDIVPKTSYNFKMLCKNKTYKNCIFHRIIKDFMIQGGDYENNDGTGGKSIYGRKFEDENFEIKHHKPYLLSMANSGSNTNGSQFFITTVETPHLDGKHVVFGEVIKGFEIIYKLNNIKTDDNDKPISNIMISDAGIYQE